MKLPDFGTLSANYPIDDASTVKADIGGDVNASWIVNTCVIRVSKAFNYAGKPFQIPHRHGLYTVKGADKKNYGLRVAEFINFLKSEYGRPGIVQSGTNISKAPFIGVTGIVAWNVSGWNDATGHFTLWDGTQGLYEGGHRYFNLPTTNPGGGPWVTKVEFWCC